MISTAAKNDAMVPTGLYMNSLNEMIDDQERRLTAIRSQVPMIVIYGLYGIAIIAVTFTGYAAGLEKQSSRLPSCVEHGDSVGASPDPRCQSAKRGIYAGQSTALSRHCGKPWRLHWYEFAKHSRGDRDNKIQP